MKKTMYVLTCNGFPRFVSEDKETLEKKRKEDIEVIINDSCLDVLWHDDSTVRYHDGIGYGESEYLISEVEVI